MGVPPQREKERGGGTQNSIISMATIAFVPSKIYGNTYGEKDTALEMKIFRGRSLYHPPCSVIPLSDPSKD